MRRLVIVVLLAIAATATARWCGCDDEGDAPVCCAWADDGCDG
jgi:hypothetical protein